MKTEPNLQMTHTSQASGRRVAACDQCDDTGHGGVTFAFGGHDRTAEEALRVALEEEAAAVLATLRAMTERH